MVTVFALCPSTKCIYYMYQFNFTDGSYFLIATQAERTLGDGEANTYWNSRYILVYRFDDYVTPSFNRTDLDGHTWTWNGTTLTFPKFDSPSTSLSVNVPNGNYVAFPLWDTGILWYNGSAPFYWDDDEFMGINGKAINASSSAEITLEDFTAQYGNNADRITNFLTDQSKIHVIKSRYLANVIVSGNGSSSVGINAFLANFPESVGNYAPDNDPYADGGQADSYGGNGVFDNSTTNIDFPTLPSISASDAGFITLFNPTLAQMKSLQNYLWGDLFDIDTFKKVLSNPMDVIMGLSIVPFDVPSGGAREIMIGNLGSGVTANVATSQFLSFDMGTLTIQSGVGDSYLDYSPYTKASIFLPYIGWQDLDIDEIMNKTLSLKYYCDILSGGCVAMLKCGGSVLYTFSGQCSLNIPLTSIDYTSTISSALSAVQHVAGAIGGVMGASASPVGKGLGIAGSVVNGVAGLGSDVMNAKPQYQRSGSVGGASGLLSPQTPYVELTRPSIQRPKFQDTFVGYPSYVYKKVSQLVGTGFNAFSEIILENIGLTADEMRELEEIMKGGVIL